VSLLNLKRKLKSPSYLAALDAPSELALPEGSIREFDATSRPGSRTFELPFSGKSAKYAKARWLPATEPDTDEIWARPRAKTRLRAIVSGITQTAKDWKGPLAGRTTRAARRSKIGLWSRREEHFRAFLEQAPVGMGLIGLDGSWQMVNERLAEVLGFTRLELASRSVQALLHPEDRAAFAASSERLIEGSTESIVERVRFVRRDGSYRSFRSTRSLARNDSGAPDRFVSVIEDISEQERAQQALRESEERYRFLFESNPQSMWVYDPITFELLAANEVASQRYGYSRPEFLGMSLNETRAADAPGSWYSNGFHGVTESDLLGAWRLCRKDGTLIDVEISSKLMRFGDRTARLVIAHDITERKRAEDEKKGLQDKLQASALEWQITFDAIESPVFVFSLAGRLLKMNRAGRDLTSDIVMEAGEAVIDNLGDGVLWQKASELMKSIRRTRVPTSLEVRDEMRRRTWQLNGTLGVLPGADDERLILVISETTNIVELQASLCRNETMSMLGSLVSGVAHEVRNPLFGISSTLDAYEACSGHREIDQRYLVVLRKEVNRLNDLMKDLLDFGQPPNRELKVGSVADAISRAVASSGPLARRSQVKVLSLVDSGMRDIQLNPERLPQVFVNLLENAIQHSPAGGTVMIEAKEVIEEGQNWIICRIKDSGRGFEAADLTRIFEPFFTRRTGGTGLGLSIVQKIVEEHHGKLTASNSPEGGAEMLVRLPVANN
jgi:PAS domain S-box-containing protein